MAIKKIGLSDYIKEKAQNPAIKDSEIALKYKCSKVAISNLKKRYEAKKEAQEIILKQEYNAIGDYDLNNLAKLFIKKVFEKDNWKDEKALSTLTSKLMEIANNKKVEG